ncbi:MAG: MFS transporter [Phycisphaerales bacterium JB063]
MGSQIKRMYFRLVFGTPTQRTQVSELRRSLHVSTVEGIFATVHIALTSGLFLTNYAIALGCPDWLLGVVDALPFLCTGFAFFSPVLVRRLRSRKRVVVGFALAHRVAWLALAVLLFVDLPGPAKQGLMVLTLLLSNAAAVVAGNAWMAWMADLVPASLRGSYYGRRNAALGVVSLAMLLLGSYVLTWFEKRGQIETGFAVCFIFAVIAALVAARTLGRQMEPPVPSQSRPQPIRQLFAEVWRTPGVPQAARFILCWQFCLGFSAAYFGAHMVRVLQMTPFEMGLLGVITSISALLAMPTWGRLDRKLGSNTVLAGSGLLIGLHVLPWLASSASMVWPVYLVGAIGGFAWAGFNLSWFNYTQALGPPELRQHTFGVIGFFQGSSFFVGSILGGLLLSLLPARLLPWEIGPWSFVNYFLIFAISAVGRLLSLRLLAQPGHPGAWRSLLQISRSWLGNTKQKQ